MADKVSVTFYDKPQIDDMMNDKADVAALEDYAKTEDLAEVALSGSYNDLSNRPTIISVTDNTTYYTMTW